MKIKINILGFVVLSLLVIQTQSVSSNEVIPGFGGVKNKPVRITSEELTIDQVAKQALFSGNAKAVQEDLTISSRRMNVLYRNKNGRLFKFLYASGDVVLIGKAQNGKPPPTAKGDLAEYNMETKKLILTGKVVLENSGQILRGQSLTIDLVSGTSQLDSVKKGKAGRVRGIFKK